MSESVEFTSLAGCSKADIELMTESYKELCSADLLADRAINMLLQQKGMFGGAQVDLLEHGLQTATRALRDGADEEMIVVCLLHDIGELLSPNNHGEIPASVLKPFISPQNWWVLAHHDVFQGHYYFEHLGGDPDTRDVYRESPHFQACVDFCSKYDAPSFDPNYDSLSIEHFRPMVKRIFSRTPYFFDPSHPKAGAVVGKGS